MMLTAIAVTLVLGPLLFVLGGIALTGILRWGASCHQVGTTIECGDFFGLFAVNPDSVSYVGAGLALAFAFLWAVGGAVICGAIGLIAAITRK